MVYIIGRGPSVYAHLHHSPVLKMCSPFVIIYYYMYSNTCLYGHAIIINIRPINSLPNPLLRAFKHLRYLYSLSISNPYQNIARWSQIHLFHHPLLPMTTFRRRTIDIISLLWWQLQLQHVSTCNISKTISHYRE